MVLVTNLTCWWWSFQSKEDISKIIKTLKGQMKVNMAYLKIVKWRKPSQRFSQCLKRPRTYPLYQLILRIGEAFCFLKVEKQLMGHI